MPGTVAKWGERDGVAEGWRVGTDADEGGAGAMLAAS